MNNKKLSQKMKKYSKILEKIHLQEIEDFTPLEWFSEEPNRIFKKIEIDNRIIFHFADSPSPLEFWEETKNGKKPWFYMPKWYEKESIEERFSLGYVSPEEALSEGLKDDDEDFNDDEFNDKINKEYEEELKEQIEEKGFQEGYEIAKANNELIGKYEEDEETFIPGEFFENEDEFASEIHSIHSENFRQFSPFEFFSKELNDLGEDAKEFWEVYEEAIYEGAIKYFKEFKGE